MGQPAARATDPHGCPMFDGPKPHVGGLISPLGAMLNVMIDNLPAAVTGTVCVCMGVPNAVLKGSLSVMIGGRPAARMGDDTIHGGKILKGDLQVWIGDMGAVGPDGFPVTIVPQSVGEVLANRPPTIKFGNIEIKPDPSDPSFQGKVVRDLSLINGTPSGHQLLQSLNDSGKKVSIEKYKGTSPNATTGYYTSAQRKADGTQGTPSDAWIKYDPEITKLSSAHPAFDAPAPIWLAHELSHADHATHGTISNGSSDNDGLKNPVTGRPIQEQNEELNTAGIPPHTGTGKDDGQDSGVTENDIRHDWYTFQQQRPWY